MFNIHAKSLYLLCSFGSRPENFQFCCRHFCQTADTDKMELQKKRGALTSPPPHIYCPIPDEELHSLPLSLPKLADTLHDVLSLENMLIYMQRLCKMKQRSPSQEAILSIKGLSRLTKFCCFLLSVPAMALRSPSCFCLIREPRPFFARVALSCQFFVN